MARSRLPGCIRVKFFKGGLDVGQHVSGLGSVDYPVIEGQAEAHHGGNRHLAAAGDRAVGDLPDANGDRGAAHRKEPVYGPVSQRRHRDGPERAGPSAERTRRDAEESRPDRPGNAMQRTDPGELWKRGDVAGPVTVHVPLDVIQAGQVNIGQQGGEHDPVAVEFGVHGELCCYPVISRYAGPCMPAYGGIRFWMIPQHTADGVKHVRTDGVSHSHAGHLGAMRRYPCHIDLGVEKYRRERPDAVEEVQCVPALPGDRADCHLDTARS